MARDPWAHWVTLYTDGSWSPSSGGYAFRARNGFAPFRIEGADRIEACADCNLAECYAVVIGVEQVLAAWGRVDGVGVRTDSQAATLVFARQAKPHRHADYRALQVRLRAALAAKEAAQGRPVFLRMIWVRGHQEDDTAQAWLNGRVDKLAKDARRKVQDSGGSL